MSEFWSGEGLELVVVDGFEGAGLLVFGDAALEEILFLLDIHHFGQPRERILDTRMERCEADTFEAAVGNIINVGGEFVGAQSPLGVAVALGGGEDGVVGEKVEEFQSRLKQFMDNYQ